MEAIELAGYADRLFAYSIKRLNNVEDAQDLAQEIMLEALKGLQAGNVRNAEAWLWKIAHNRYAHFVAQRQPAAPLDGSGLSDMLETSAEESPDTLTIADEERAVFEAVHSIAKSHRDILIDYYVAGLSCGDIARKYGLPPGTVRTRLYYGRKKLKERWQSKMDQKNVYGAINWFVFGNGDVYPQRYCQRQLRRAILTVCYGRALTAEEISLRTGVPCLYIEDEITELVGGELLTERNGRYLTNIIIFPESLIKQIETSLLGGSPALAAHTAQVLERYDAQIRGIGFYGSRWNGGKIGWFLVPLLLREACEEARRQNGAAARVPNPPRRDGSSGWIFVSESADEKRRYLSGCNSYWRDNGVFTYYWSGKYRSGEVSDYLRRLEDVPGLRETGDIGKLSAVQLAEGIKYNILGKDADGFKWAIAVFTRAQADEMNRLKKEMALKLAPELLPYVNRIYTLMQKELPKHLHDQITGAFGAELNSVIAMVCDRLEEQGVLEKPSGDYFTGQILMTTQK